MKLEFSGGASEVGRSCVQLTLNNGERYLFDVGVKFKEDGFQLPENIFDVPKLSGVFLSHAHLDHSGGLPLFEHKDLRGPIFCTRQTFELTRILLKDSYKIQRIRHLHPAYDKTDLKEVRKDTLLVRFDKWYKHKSVRFMYLNAAHIPGSAMILLEAEGKRILYTGDFNTKKSLLMKGLEISPVLKERKLDALITESTYGHTKLPERDFLENEFVDEIKTTLKQKGSVLIPVFTIGRAQEIMIMLSKYDFKVPVYVEGLCKQVTSKILKTPSEYVDHVEELYEEFYNRAKWIGSPKNRMRALQKQGIFITTSGMLQGGPVLEYLKSMWGNPKNTILLTGFQCKRTNGDHLLNEGFVYLDGWKTYVKCKVKKFDFSGHTDADGIKHFVESLKPEIVFFQHGDLEAVTTLKKWADTELIEAYAPKIGESYNI